jgi:hypothetical protein
MLLFCVVFFALFVTFLRNVSATVSDDREELLDIRTAITHLELNEYFYFNDAKDLLLLLDKVANVFAVDTNKVIKNMLQLKTEMTALKYKQLAISLFIQSY